MVAVMSPLLTCPECGAPVRADAVRCERCGARTLADPPPRWRVRAVVGAVAALFLVAAVWGFGAVLGQWSHSPVTPGSDPTAAAGPSPRSSSPSSKPAPSPTSSPSAASGSVPQGARLCDGGGDLRAYAGTPRTSCSFAVAVRDAFVGAGGVSDAASRTVRAHSTVTGTTYTMTCEGTTRVTCRGGTGAVIYLVP